MPLQRSRHLLSCAILGAALLLSACGFHPRGTGTGTIQLQELSVSTQDNHSLARRTVVDALRNHGVQVTATSRYQLQLLDEAETRRAYNTAQRSIPIEQQLNSQLTFQITNRAGQTLYGPETLSYQRSYSADRDNVTGNAIEEELLQREMREELANRLVTQLSRISVSDLEAREQALQRNGQSTSAQ